ncbi:MAG: hypothetical protein K0Q80_3007 [Microvirga sp.]|jgi:hypothetical protein|nr:hypothetical protein [Microvirga sp.]
MRKLRRTNLRLIAGVACGIPLAGCVTVETPDKPIEINLNVEIRQEVLVRLQQDAQQLIQQNPDAFPQTPSQPQRP